MSDRPYAILLGTSQDDLVAEEYKLATASIGTKLTGGSLTKVSQETVSDSVVVTLERSLEESSDDFYEFDAEATSIEMMAATGNPSGSGDLLALGSYHGYPYKATGSLTLSQPLIGLSERVQ
mmetsp:Transcript_91583/g.191444  ORF Transcript_91583/g.191444 Transcript_91583/m.191444 type:complete len:122 (-) Transcript_91583:9-374(-)